VRILIYQNPDAGHEPRPASDVISELQRAGHEARWLNAQDHTLDDDDLREVDVVVAAGGDGNVGRTARQLLGREIPIAILPLGTANNLGTLLESQPHDLPDRIRRWRMLPFDAGILQRGDDRMWFFEGFGMGTFAETAAMLTARAETHPEPNREAELTRDIHALAERARAQPPLDCEVHVDGVRLPAPPIMLEVLNIGLIGPNVPVAPQADPSDGALDVVAVYEPEREALTNFLEACARGEQPQAPPFHIQRATQVLIDCRAACVAHVDGSSVELAAGEQLDVGIRRHAVRFLRGEVRSRS
jgi:diacylglycerol kinase family enzyme